MTGANTANGPAGKRSTRRAPLLRPTGRTRTAVFLCVNLLAYALANAFICYVGTGRWISPTLENFRGGLARPLNEMVLGPLSIFTHPWMILVTGLLLAVVIAVPLLVAALYHVRYCVLFLACVPLLARAPMLTIVLSAGCALVVITPLRRRNPTLATLGGLLPVWLYLYLGGIGVPAVAQPMERFVLHVPLMIAGLGAFVAVGAVLLIAHWTRYRPGVIWPVVAVLLAVPAWLFYQRVGADELAYALLAERLTASDAAFGDQTLQHWGGRGEDAQDDLKERKADLVAACEQFARRYPRSDRLSAVLWIQGIALDTQISRPKLQVKLVHYYDRYPLAASESTWQRLVREFPADPRSGVARRRLALMAAREGRLAEAKGLLAEAADVLAAAVAAGRPTRGGRSRWDDVFVDDPGLPSWEYLQRVAREIERLRWLMRANGVADPRNLEAGKAFSAYVRLDGDQFGPVEFAREIRALGRKYINTDLLDNLYLAEAMAQTDLTERARMLVALSEQTWRREFTAKIEARYDLVLLAFRAMAVTPAAETILRDLSERRGPVESDAMIEANYELGLLALGAEDIKGLKGAQVYFRRVLAAKATDHPWRRLAEEQLARLQVKEGRKP